MKLKQVKLQNIRSYTDGVIDFPEGAVLLSGDIGAGKTTILLAIEFALFGILRGVVNGDSLLRHGKQSGSVELKIEIDGKELIIRRNLKRARDDVRQDSGYIIMDGVKSDATAVELKSRILEMLGYSHELLAKSRLIYRYTVYTPQEEMKQILLENPEYRVDTIRKLFQIDKYKRIRDNSLILARNIKERIIEASSKIEDTEEKRRQREDAKAELENEKAALVRILREFEECGIAILESKEGLKKLEGDIAVLNELKAKIRFAETRASEKKGIMNDLDNESAVLNRKISECEGKLNLIIVEDVSGEAETEKNLAVKEQEYHKIIDKNSRLQEELRNIEIKIREYETEVRAKLAGSARLGRIKAELIKLESESGGKGSLKTQLAGLEAKEKNIVAEIGRLGLLAESSHKAEELLGSDKCPVCRQPLTESHKNHLFSEEKERAKEAKKTLDRISSERNSIEEKMLSLKKELEIIVEMEKRAEGLRKEISMLEEAEKEIQSKKGLIAGMESKRESLESPVNAAPVKEEILGLKRALSGINESKLKIAEKEHLKKSVDENKNRLQKLAENRQKLGKELETLESEILDLKGQVLGFAGRQEECDKKKLLLTGLMESEKQILVSRASGEKGIESLEKAIAHLDSELLRREKIKAKLQTLRQVQNWVEEYFINLMITMEKHVMRSVHQNFNELFRSWFGMLMENEMINVRLDDEFSPVIEQDGFETSFESLSGGERTGCALAYRNAARI